MKMVLTTRPISTKNKKWEVGKILFMSYKNKTERNELVGKKMNGITDIIHGIVRRKKCCQESTWQAVVG